MNNPLNETELTIIRDILNLSLTEQVNAKEYRRKNAFNMSVIKKLADTQVLRHDYEADIYRLSLVALYLADNDISDAIFKDADKICEYLREQFISGKDQHSFQDIEKGTGLSLDRIDTCITYLRDSPAISCNYNRDTDVYTIQINESVFEFKQLKEYTKGFAVSWYPDHYNQKPEKKPSKHAERHSKKREEILGAALSVLANFPNLCKNDQGTVEGRKIAQAIDEKYALFFPNDEEPPLAFETSERLINSWLSKAR